MVRSLLIAACLALPAALAATLPSAASATCPLSVAAAPALAAINAERAKAGLGALQSDDRLTAAAQRMSCHNGARKATHHVTADGADLSRRLRDAGFGFREAAENVYTGRGDALAAVKWWMNSAGHRANLLNPAHSRIGFWAAASGDGRNAYVIVLARPR
jgi:uncharacterized protein YkwD